MWRQGTAAAFWAAVLLLALSAGVARGGEPDKPDAKEAVRNAFANLAGMPMDQMWEVVTQLARLGRDADGAQVVALLKEGLQHESTKIRLASARALCQLHETEAGMGGLSDLIKTNKDPDVRRLAANTIGLTATLWNNPTAIGTLTQAMSDEKEPRVRICIARSLLRITAGRSGTDALMELIDAKEKEVRDEACLVLAENGFINHSKVRDRLLLLYSEPTAQGERAFNLLRHAEEIGRSNRPANPKVMQGEQLLREVVNNILLAYPDDGEKKLADPDRLFEEAAKGMVGSLDSFSQYLDREEVKATHEKLSQDYGGIGAYVGMRDNVFTIMSPIYGSPADKAGLRALDRIIEVDGTKTSDITPAFTGVIQKLKGQPGTPVKIKYWRRGFSKPVQVTLTRARIRVESVHSDAFPGEIGYIRLSQFGERSTAEMAEAIEAVKRKGMKGLIFDLRDNPGGLLRGAVEVADFFLGGRKLVVYSEGRQEFQPRKDFFSGGDEAQDEGFPMVVLINSGSASASEIVAGAMRDHKRAMLVGAKTYGKGSVQQIMPLSSTARETELRLTIAKYYLPSGQCIHEKGIEPDVKAEPAEIAAWKVEEYNGWAETGVLQDYVRKYSETHKDALLKLSQEDGKDPSAYPDFDKLYESLKTRAEKDEVRQNLRAAVRRWAQDELKRMFACDLQEDDVLQRGVFELLKKLKTDPAGISQYKDFPKKFADAPKTDIEKIMANDKNEKKEEQGK